MSYVFKKLIVLSCLLCLPVLAADFSSWQHGAVGYFKAERFARNKKKPMLVYFHTDWCEKCARLDANFLNNRVAKRLIDKFSRVEINPEEGPKDHAIFTDYQTQAVPGLYIVFPSFDSKFKRIHPLGKNGDWTIKRFTQEISTFSAQTYREEGMSLFGRGDYRGAAKLLEQSLTFDDKNGEAYFDLGRCYEAMGDSYRQRAQQYFAKAARLDSRFDLRGNGG